MLSQRGHRHQSLSGSVVVMAGTEAASRIRLEENVLMRLAACRRGDLRMAAHAAGRNSSWSCGQTHNQMTDL